MNIGVVRIKYIAAISWFVGTVLSFGLALSLGLFHGLSPEEQGLRSVLDRLFPWFVFGGGSIVMAYQGFRELRELQKLAKTERKFTTSRPSRPSQLVRRPADPMPEGFAPHVRNLLDHFAAFGITLKDAPSTRAPSTDVAAAFIDALWRELQWQADMRALPRPNRADPQDLLLEMSEDRGGHPFSAEVMRYPIDLRYDYGLYPHIAQEFRRLARGMLPLEHIEETAVDGKGRRLALCLHLDGHDHHWEFEPHDSDSGLDIITKLASLLPARHQPSGKKLRFAADAAQGIVVMLRDDELAAFNALIGQDCFHWLDKESL